METNALYDVSDVIQIGCSSSNTLHWPVKPSTYSCKCTLLFLYLYGVVMYFRQTHAACRRIFFYWPTLLLRERDGGSGMIEEGR
jgi:hypothetical protein